MSVIIRIGKKIKRLLKKILKRQGQIYISPVRRINQVASRERICAMTFDDGPSLMPASPDNFDGKPLTAVLLDTLAEFGAKATFDVVGDTSANYPDAAGKEGSAQWGGVKFDHYPDINHDSEGGAENCSEMIDRILTNGHEISNHGYRHIIFGPQPLVYGGRESISDIVKIEEDLRKLDSLLEQRHGYKIRLSRPPHYVDKIGGALTSYDAYTLLGYQYMGASFDGAGWLPRPEYKAELDDMIMPLEAALTADADAMCGQIIFQKDGFNMTRRTPIADALRPQLELLKRHGYKVVSVSELMEKSCCADVYPDEPVSEAISFLLERGHSVLFNDNCFHAEKSVTRGEFAAFLAPIDSYVNRIRLLSKDDRRQVCADVALAHKYGGAVQFAIDSGAIPLVDGKFRPSIPVTSAQVSAALKHLFSYDMPQSSELTRSTLVVNLAQAIRQS